MAIDEPEEIAECRDCPHPVHTGPCPAVDCVCDIEYRAAGWSWGWEMERYETDAETDRRMQQEKIT